METILVYKRGGITDNQANDKIINNGTGMTDYLCGKI